MAHRLISGKKIVHGLRLTWLRSIRGVRIELCLLVESRQSVVNGRNILEFVAELLQASWCALSVQLRDPASEDIGA